MIRVALVADTHADEHNRLAEHDRVMTWIAEDIVRREVDLVLHAGDWWERARTTAPERAAVKRWVLAVTEHAPLVGVAGNHDGPVDVEWLGKLRTRHPAHMFTSPGVVHVAGCAIGAVPWPRKAHLLSALGTDVSLPEAGRIANEYLQNVLRGLGAEMRENGAHRPRILLGHLMIDGALTDHSQPLVGADMAVSLTDLALADATFIGAGHIHASTNAWEIAGIPCVYPGAPRHVNFGEAGPNKGYVIATFDEADGRCLGWERIATPCAPMILLENEWDEERGCWRRTETLQGYGPIDGAEIRFRFATSVPARSAARASAAIVRDVLLGAGAAVVKLDERVIATTRARASDVAAATDVADQLSAMWNRKRSGLGDERKTALVSKLDEIRKPAA